MKTDVQHNGAAIQIKYIQSESVFSDPIESRAQAGLDQNRTERDIYQKN